MAGKLVKRNGAWTTLVDLGWQVDPETGEKKRRRFRFTFRGKKRKAQEELNDVLTKLQQREFAEPSKITTGEWLDHWLETSIKPAKRIRTWEAYKSIAAVHLKPAFGSIRLQELDQIHLERYYSEKSSGEKPLSQTTLEHHHAVISGALSAAQRRRLVRVNVAKLVESKPRAPESNDYSRQNCWNEKEVKAFLNAAKEKSPQAAAFYSLALDTGARKGELCGLKWDNVDLLQNRITMSEQLVKPGPTPLFGPPKRGRARSIPISPETAKLLRAHKSNQAELKLKNRIRYHDFGLVFAKEWDHMTGNGAALGQPLQMNNLGQREFADLIKAAGVRKITFHGMRHTCATLLLKAGVPVKVVSERLGHRGVEITMNLYVHVLPDMQQEAADKLGSILHG